MTTTLTMRNAPTTVRQSARRTASRALSTLGIVALISAAGVAPAPAHMYTSPASQRILVRFRTGVAPRERAAAVTAAGARMVRMLPEIRTAVIAVPRASGIGVAIARLRARRAVESIERDVTGRIALDPDDSCATGCGPGRQWDLGAVNAPGGWGVFPGRFYTQTEKRTASTVKVAVLDTKIDTRLADWVNEGGESVSNAFDAANGGQLDMPDEPGAADFVKPGNQDGPALYHGSFVAGILGASADNGVDIAGFGYAAQVMPVTVVDGGGHVAASDLASGILYAWEQGARVVNLSLGLDSYSKTVQEAILAVRRGSAEHPGALVVAAAGNGGSDGPFYPAQMDGVLSVSAVDEADRPGACTNHNLSVGVAAPGVGVLSLDTRAPGGLSIGPCGTSTATPHVSALAALLFAQKPSRTPADVEAIIKRNADDANFQTLPRRDDYLGSGRVNFERALMDGVGPVVDRVAATFPRAVGGDSEVTATGTARSAGRPIEAAEWFLDSLGSPGSGVTAGQILQAADGTFDEASEGLVGSVRVPLGALTGVHRLFVRAFDGTEWGAASVGVLIVDRTPPKVTGMQVSPVAVALAGQSVRISFGVSDDFASTLTYTFTIVRKVAGDGEIVFESQPKTIPAPGRETVEWTPDLLDAGHFGVELTVWDEAGNPAHSYAETSVL